MTDIDKIEDTDEAWDNNTLGNDARFAKVATDVNQANIDEALGLKMISIRLESDLIDTFKNIASLHGGIGYQTLMRQVLKRFADCEMKQLLRDAAANAVKAAEAAAGAKNSGKIATPAVTEGMSPPKRHRKAA
jgi:predicted DNA binding CopG/RHH family protein